MRSFSVTSANIGICDISLKTRLFGLHFRDRLCRSIFNYFDVIGPKATEFGEKCKITAMTPFKVIQGDLFWFQWKAHMRDFLLVINTNLHPILHRFVSYCRLLVKFALLTEWYLLLHGLLILGLYFCGVSRVLCSIFCTDAVVITKLYVLRQLDIICYESAQTQN